MVPDQASHFLLEEGAMENSFETFKSGQELFDTHWLYHSIEMPSIISVFHPHISTSWHK